MFDAAAKQLVWTGTLGPGEHATITYSVKVHDSAAGLVRPMRSMARPGRVRVALGAGAAVCHRHADRPPAGARRGSGADQDRFERDRPPGGPGDLRARGPQQGPREATGVTVQDPIPSGLFLQSAQPSQGTCTLTVEQLVCGLGSLVSGGQALVSVTYTVAADASGTLVNEADVFGDQPDPDPANNIARSAITVTPLPVAPPDPGPQPIANLVVTKHVNHATALVGQTLTYTIKVTNTGPERRARRPGVRRVKTAAEGALDPPRAGQLTTGRPIHCRLGTLASHAHTTITIKAIAQTAGVQVNAAAATSGSWDPAVRNNLALAKTRIRPAVTPPPPTVTARAQPRGSAYQRRSVTLPHRRNDPQQPRAENDQGAIPRVRNGHHVDANAAPSGWGEPVDSGGPARQRMSHRSLRRRSRWGSREASTSPGRLTGERRGRGT